MNSFLGDQQFVFQTDDGIVLRGEFLAQPNPAPTVIVCHGYHISREYLRSTTAYIYTLFGCNLLLFDFRGHGESDRVAISLGNGEVHDLQAAITVASQQPEIFPGAIVLHGFSMGAAVALLVPPRPEVAAIIADSPTKWQISTASHTTMRCLIWASRKRVG